MTGWSEGSGIVRADPGRIPRNAFSYLLTLRLIPFSLFPGQSRLGADAHFRREPMIARDRDHSRQLRVCVCRATARQDQFTGGDRLATSCWPSHSWAAGSGADDLQEGIQGKASIRGRARIVINKQEEYPPRSRTSPLILPDDEHNRPFSTTSTLPCGKIPSPRANTTSS